MTEILRVLIDETGLSVRKFAESCGLPPTTIYGMFKNGCEKSSVNTIITICEYLKVNIEDVRKLSLNEVVTKEDVLHLKDMYAFLDSDKIINELKERSDLVQLMRVFEKLHPSDVQALIDALGDATPEDIALISNLLRRINRTPQPLDMSQLNPSK